VKLVNLTVLVLPDRRRTRCVSRDARHNRRCNVVL